MREEKVFILPSGEGVPIDDSGFIETKVVMSVSALIDHDFEGFLDLVSLCATDTELLTEIEYEALSITSQGNVIFRVKGNINMILDDDMDFGSPEPFDIEGHEGN